MADDQQTINNPTSNQGAQGIFNAPVTINQGGPNRSPTPPPTPPRPRRSPWIQHVIVIGQYICLLIIIITLLTGVSVASIWLLQRDGPAAAQTLAPTAYDPRLYLAGVLAGATWVGLQFLRTRIRTDNIPPPADATSHLDPDEVFVGRDQEIQAIVSYLTARQDQRAVVIIRGMPGVGKTQLARAVIQAARRQGLYPDGAVEVAMGGNVQPLDSTTAMRTVLTDLDPTTFVPPGNLAGVYDNRLQRRRVLILADDAHDRMQVENLVPPAHSALLITTRSRFRLHRVTSFHACDLTTLAPAAARTMLRTLYPRIGKHADTLAEQCGYLPLALRICALLLATDDDRPLPAFLDQFTQTRLTLLRDPDHPNDPQASVEAAISLSYAALPPAAQTAFAQLGIFIGSFHQSATLALLTPAAQPTPPATDPASPQPASPDPANTLSPQPSALSPQDALSLLRRRSLLDYTPTTQHYRMHDLLRDYALARLAASGAEFPTRLRHATYYAQVAYYAQFELYLKGKPVEGLALFDQERRHIDAAWTWVRESAERKAQSAAPDTDLDRLVLAFADATAHVGELRYDLRRERIPQLEAQRAAARRLGDWHGEGTALGNLGSAYADLGDYPTAIAFYEQALTIRRAIGDRRGEGADLGNLGSAYADLGDYPKAIAYHEQALTISRAIGDRRGEGTDLGNLGNAYRNLGDYPKAIAYHEQALTISRAIGDRRGEGADLGNLGRAYFSLGDYPQAIAYHQHALAIDQEIGNVAGVAQHSWNLGLIYAAQGDLPRAVELMQVQVDFFQRINHPDAVNQAARLAALRRQIP